METFQETGKRLSNWGRWGADDERGTLNLVTAERVATAQARQAAAAHARAAHAHGRGHGHAKGVTHG